MKRCAYCRARATYRIQRGDKKIERVLGVRPRLENPDHAEREVANLLRAKDAIEVLESPP